MKFILEVDLDKIDGDTGKELSRILRYWAGAMKQLPPLSPGDRQDLSDSDYTVVGAWRVED